MDSADSSHSPDCIDVWFNALDPEPRLALAACLKGRTAPRPLWRRLLNGFMPWILLLLTGVILGAATILWPRFDSQYGSREFLLLCGAGMAVAAGYLGLMRCAAVRRALPYPEGDFLFAGQILEVRGDRIRAWELARARTSRLLHHRSGGIYQFSNLEYLFRGRAFLFRVRGLRKAEELARRHALGQVELITALEAGDMEAAARLDPLLQLRLSGALEAPARRPRLGRSHLRDRTLARPLHWPVRSIAQAMTAGSIAGFLTGVVIYLQVKARHDDDLFVRAKTERTVSSLTTYIDRGGRRAAEARELITLVTLEDALQAGSVSRLREFVRENPDHPGATAARDAIRELYAGALAALTRNAKPEAAAFLTRLLQRVENTQSPEIQVHFHPPGTDDLGKLETLMKQHDGFVQLPGRSFGAEACRRREKTIFVELQRGFRSVVKSDIIRLIEPEKAEPAAKVPRLEIRYRVEASGTIYTQKDWLGGGLAGALQGRGAGILAGANHRYAGLKFGFTIVLTIPDDDPPWTIVFEVRPAESFSVRTPGLALSAPTDDVYDAMAGTAFASLSEKLNEEILSKPAKENRTTDGNR
jgi:hypothetical protein